MSNEDGRTGSEAGIKEKKTQNRRNKIPYVT